MEHHRIEWLRAGADANHVRQMYQLAKEVYESTDASARHRRAARHVVKSLHVVIDLPIAEARILATARRRFDGLLNALREA